MNINEITEKIYKVVLKHYMNKIESNAKLAFPVIKHVYENQREKFKRIVVPFSDGVKTLQVITNLEKAFESGGNQLITDFEKNITLAIYLFYLRLRFLQIIRMLKKQMKENQLN